MTQQDIEKEVQVRVDFKMNELINACTNIANTNFGAAFTNGHPKYTYYIDAFKQFKQMIVKEKNMCLPFDSMIEEKRRTKKNEAVDKLSDRLLKMGSKDYRYLQTVINDIVEEAQRY